MKTLSSAASACRTICHAFITLLTLGSLLLATSAQASYAYYVGKNLTEDGSVMMGGTGEEVSSHWLEIVRAFPRRSPMAG